MVWRILKYIEHLCYRRHIRGRHIHSPYLFDFVHLVIFNASKTEVPVKIREVHTALRNDRSLIRAGTLGATSSVDSSENRTVCSFIRHSSVSRKQGALLFRITQWFKPETVLELGTGLGVSTLYLAWGVGETAARKSGSFSVHTIEGDPARADFSRQLFKRFGLNGVKVHCGDVDRSVEELAGSLPGRFLAFVDANHRYEPTIQYVEHLMAQRGDEAVIIMDDIYWSREMNLAWKEVISWPAVRVSIDLFHMGILLLRKDLQKTHLKIKI